MAVAIEWISFNHDPAGATTDALNIRKNATELIAVPEWRAGVSVVPEDSRAAYSMQDTSGQVLTVQARFRWTGPLPSQPVEIRALDPTVHPAGAPGCAGFLARLLRVAVRGAAGNVLGEVAARPVSFGAGGLSAAVTFQLQNTRIGTVGVGVHEVSWRWQHRVGGGPWIDFATTSHRIYTVLETPKAPWSSGPFDGSNTQLPWTDVLDRSCAWAAGATDRDAAAGAITAAVYDLGNSVLEYDCPNGGMTHYAWPSFDCTAFLERLAGGPGNGQYVNCTDCATIVSTFVNAVGGDLWQSRMGSFFALNPLLAIGSSTWQTACGWGSFSYHEVAWKGACGASDPVFDACLKVDGDADPTSAPHVPLLPVDIPFGTPGSGGYRDALSPSGSCDPQPNTRQRRIVT